VRAPATRPESRSRLCRKEGRGQSGGSPLFDPPGGPTQGPQWLSENCGATKYVLKQHQKKMGVSAIPSVQNMGNLETQPPRPTSLGGNLHLSLGSATMFEKEGRCSIPVVIFMDEFFI